MSSATWWTSRTSPASTIRPTFMRFWLRIRWWWIAEVISRLGTGASSRLESRSDSTMNSAPRSIARSTSSRIASMRSCSARSPSSTRYSPRTTVVVADPGAASMCCSFASSSLSMTGKSSTT